MSVLGKYDLIERMGHGGFGTVYRAMDTTLGREVALKILHPQLTIEPDFLERFRNEARMVASLRSPNIVTIYELGEAEGRVFISMEFLSGGSLRQKLEEEGALPFNLSMEIIDQVCAGLHAAHRKGLVHRDVKPANILFDAEGHAVIADFGLARAVQMSSTVASSSVGGIGTPAYRAPELWLGKPPASPATDIYSLGCVLSEMLSGQTLFDGTSTDVVITQHLVEGPKIPDNLPQPIQTILQRALEKKPEDRFQSAPEFMRACRNLDDAGGVQKNAFLFYQPIEPADQKIVQVPEKAQGAREKPVEGASLEKLHEVPQPAAKKNPRSVLNSVILSVIAVGIVALVILLGDYTGWFDVFQKITPTAFPSPTILTNTIKPSEVIPTSTNTQAPAAVVGNTSTVTPTPTKTRFYSSSTPTQTPTKIKKTKTPKPTIVTTEPPPTEPPPTEPPPTEPPPTEPPPTAAP